MNLVLIPGLLGFGEILGFSYFKELKQHLEIEMPGVRVLPTGTDWLGTIEDRAASLDRDLRRALDAGVLSRTEPIHLVGHSMGGLAARRFVHERRTDMPPVATVTCVGTPHMGSPVAALLDNPFPLSLLSTLPLPGTRIIDLLRNNFVHELSPSGASAFNDDYPDLAGVEYRNIVGTGRPGSGTSLFFQPTWLYLNSVGEPSDGIVPISSATREPLFASWPGDHADLIGHDLNDVTAAPPERYLDGYRALVRALS